MSTQITRTIGKAKVTVNVSGCVDCGSERSIGWEDERRHQIVIGSRNDYITLQRCADCAEKRGAKWPAQARERTAGCAATTSAAPTSC